MTIKSTAHAFVNGKAAACHNAKTDGTEYLLHGHRIAWRDDTSWHFDWCGFYTLTTANHLNHIMRALGKPGNLSYASARNNQITQFGFTF